MTFIAAATSHNSTHLIADSLLSSPPISSKIFAQVRATWRGPLASTGLLIGDVTKRAHREALKIANWSGLAMGLSGDWGPSQKAFRLVDEQVKVAGGMSIDELPGFLSKISIELDLRPSTTLECVGITASAGRDRKFRMDFVRNQFNWAHDPSAVVVTGTGGRYLEHVVDDLNRILRRTPHPTRQHMEIADKFVAEQICQQHALTSDLLIGGAVYGVFSYAGQIFWMPARTMLVYILKDRTTFDPRQPPDFIMRLSRVGDAVVSMTVPRGAIVLRSNSISEDHSWDEQTYRQAITLNSSFFSVIFLDPDLNIERFVGFNLELPPGKKLFEEQLDLGADLPLAPYGDFRVPCRYQFCPTPFFYAVLLEYLAETDALITAEIGMDLDRIFAAEKIIDQGGMEAWLQSKQQR